MHFSYRIHCKTGMLTTTMLQGTASPKDYLLCDGRTLRKQDYPELYEIIGTTYGSPGNDEFRIPDLRGSVTSTQYPNYTTPEEYVEIDGNEWTMRELERVTTPDGWD